MRKIFGILGILVLLFVDCQEAQAYDVVQLKDGSVVDCIINTTLENGDLGVTLRDGNVKLIEYAEIASISKNDEALNKKIKRGPIGIGIRVGYIRTLSSDNNASSNGVYGGVTYTLNFAKLMFFEPGLNVRFIRQLFKERNYYRGSNEDCLGWEMPLRIGLNYKVSQKCAFQFKVGPVFSMIWNGSRLRNISLGLRPEMGFTFMNKHYAGVGFDWELLREHYGPPYLSNKINFFTFSYGINF